MPGFGEKEGSPLECVLISSGTALVGVELGLTQSRSTCRLARPCEPSKKGESRPGVFGTEVGAVEYPPADDCDEYELS